MKKYVLIILLIILFILTAILLLSFSYKNERENKIDLISEDRIQENINSKVKYLDSSYLAIAYLTENNKDQFINKYLDDDKYSKITKLSIGNQYEFILMPKYENVKISVNKCNIDDTGNLYQEETILKNYSGNLIVSINDFEYIPIISFTVEYNNKSYTFPLLFSGKDGKLFFEENVTDISIYNQEEDA